MNDMTKNTGAIAVDVDEMASRLAALTSEPENDEGEADQAIEQDAAPAKPSVEPIDLFGDSSLTGRQELTEDMLPAPIWNYAKDTAERMGINTGPIAIGCLVAAATAIRAGWKVQPKRNDTTWFETPILWYALFGSSGVKKSSALNAATLPLDMIEDAWAEQGEEARKQYWREKAEFNEEMKGWRKACQQIIKGGGDREDFPPLPEKPEDPEIPRLVVKDTTIESVMKVCAANPAGIVQVRDELAEWIGSFDLYSGGSGSRDRAKYLTAYNGGSETKDRAGDENGPLRIPSFSVSIMGGIQDDLVAKRFSKTAADGFLARFLFVKGEILPGCDRSPDKAALSGYVNLISRLAGREVEEENGEDGIVWMSPEAASLRERIEEMSRALHDHPSICKGLSDHLNKWPGIFSRLCLVFHMIEALTSDSEAQRFSPKFRAISGETAERAYRLLTEYFLPEAARIYNDVMQGDENAAHAKWIAGHILAHKKEKISTHEIGRAFSAIKDDFLAIEKATRVLELMGWITPAPKADGTSYHRSDFSKMKWRVNQAVHTMFAEQAQVEAEQRKATQERIQQGATAIRELRSPATAA